MRLAYVCADAGVPVFGSKGCSVHVQEVLRAFAARGIDVELFAARDGGQAPPDLACVPLHRLPRAPSGDDPDARERHGLALDEELLRELDLRGPFDAVYERYSLWSVAGMEYARAAGIPGVLEVNAPLVEEQAAYRGLVRRAAAERVRDRAFTLAAAIVAVSRAVADHVFDCAGPRPLVEVVENGVDPDRFTPWVPPDSPAPGTFTVGFVGTLKPWHGLSTLVEAFGRLASDGAPCRLLVVGDGPEGQQLHRQMADRGWSRALLHTGLVDPARVPALLTSLDVAVAPYPRVPGFYFSPLKVVEYMAAGRAIVATRVGDLPRLVRHEQNGLLCSPDDPAALAQCLRRLRDDPLARLRLGRAARRGAVARHSWAAAADRILRIVDAAAKSASVLAPGVKAG